MVAMDSEKLNLNKDFRRLYGRGKSFVSPLLVTYIMRTKRNVVRYGITTGKKVGGAVERNRARRVIQAAMREIGAQTVMVSILCLLPEVKPLSPRVMMWQRLC